MHKRDAGILLVALVALAASLQREGVFSFRKAWYYSHEESSDVPVMAHHKLPPPLVADLNGDGHYEVIVASPSYTIQVLAPAPHSAVASGFMGAKKISQVSLMHRTVVASANRRPVALAVGHIDHAPQSHKGVLAPRKQVLVVVTAGLQVLCYDHNLKLMWEKDISSGLLHRHTRVKEVAVHISPHQVSTGDRGLIVVGTSVQQGDLASGEGVDLISDTGSRRRAVEDDEDVFAAAERHAADLARHARSASRGSLLEDLDSSYGAGSSGDHTDTINSQQQGSQAGGGRIKGLDASRHFNYHGFEGATGDERWHHTATDFHKDLPELAAGLRPQNDYRLDAEKLEGRHFGEASCREYRESILHTALPHAWDTPLDTHMTAAHFVKHKTGRGAAKEHLATKDAKGRRPHATGTTGHQPPASHTRPAHTVSSLVGARRSQRADPHAVAGAGAHDANHPTHANITANSLVVHLEEGIEVIHLYTGRTICQLHLPAGELHADINGDGVVDHVQVYRGSDAAGAPGDVDLAALAGEAGGRQHRAASHCTAITTSGIPPQHHLWRANVCKTSRFMAGSSAMGSGVDALLRASEDAGGRDAMDGMEILTPVFLPLPRLGKGFAGGSHHHGLVITLNSRGEVTALSSRGIPVWQATYEELSWTPSHTTEMDSEEAAAATMVQATLTPMSLHVHGVPGSVLAAGEQGAVVLSEHGRVLASFDLPLRPSQRLVVADFNGDGLNDIIEVTAMGVFGWAQVQHLGGNTLSILLAVATVAMALLLWNSGALFSGAGGTAGQRKLRSTEYTD